MTDPQSKPPALQDPAFMRAFLDLVIPPSGGGKLPGAGELDLVERFAAEAEADPMFGPVISAGLEAVRAAALEADSNGLPGLSPEARLALVQGQLATHGMLMFGVARFLYPAYYQHPSVLQGLGQPPRPPFPDGFEVEDTDPALLEALRARARRPAS